MLSSGGRAPAPHTPGPRPQRRKETPFECSLSLVAVSLIVTPLALVGRLALVVGHRQVLREIGTLGLPFVAQPLQHIEVTREAGRLTVPEPQETSLAFQLVRLATCQGLARKMKDG